MKKVIALLGIYLLMITSSVSCRKVHVLITDIRFLGASINYTGVEPKFNHYDSTTVFTEDLIFVISYSTEYVACLNSNLIQSCYATKYARIYDNKLLQDTYSITFDKPFVYENDTIPAEQNIFQIGKIKSEINIFESNMAFEGAGADEIIDFSDNFNKKVKFDTQIYRVKFSCKTSDNREFENHIDVEFKRK